MIGATSAPPPWPTGICELSRKARLAWLREDAALVLGRPALAHSTAETSMSWMAEVGLALWLLVMGLRTDDAATGSVPPVPAPMVPR
jgi:hypothetical protein